MRKVTRTIARAFFSGDSESCGNTRTDGKSVWLHGNKIAYKNENGNLFITNAGFETNVTKERLNGLLQLGVSRFPVPRIFQKNFRWYLATGHIPAIGKEDKKYFQPTVFPCNEWVDVESELNKAQKLDQFLHATVSRSLYYVR